MIYINANTSDDFHPILVYYKSHTTPKSMFESRGCSIFPPSSFNIVGFGFHHYQKKMDIKFVKKIISNDIGIVYVCDELPRNYIIHDKLVYVVTRFYWFTHTLFKNPLVFKAVFSSNSRDAAKEAKKFSHYTGFKVPLIHSYKDIDKVIKVKQNITIDKQFLIETFDGLGDVLMTLPTAYTLNQHGWKVSYYTYSKYKELFKNLDFVDLIYTSRSQIPFYKFGAHVNLTHRLSDYRMSINRQHRIYSTANFCGLSSADLLINKPIIVLDRDEVEYGYNLLKGCKKPTVGICYEAFGFARSYPTAYVQQLINKLEKSFTPVLIGSSNKIQFTGSVIDIRGKTSLRQLFSLINSLNFLITVDTGVLHVAGAFDTPTIALMGPIPAEWRCSTYKNCYSLHTACKFYKCADRQLVPLDRAPCKNNDTYCLSTIDPTVIYRKLLAIAKK